MRDGRPIWGGRVRRNKHKGISRTCKGRTNGGCFVPSMPVCGEGAESLPGTQKPAICGNEKDLYDCVGMPLQCVAAYEDLEGTWKMAEKTIVEKAAEKVGYGLAMAEDVAGSVKTAFGSAVATVTNALTPAKETPKPATKNADVKNAAKKAPVKKAVKKAVAKKAPSKKTAAKKVARKAVKKPAKKAGRTRR